LFEVFSRRYERGSTLVTSSLPFDEWTEVFSSELGALPLMDHRWVNAEPGRQLGNRLFALQCLKCHFSFELGINFIALRHL